MEALYVRERDSLTMKFVNPDKSNRYYHKSNNFPDMYAAIEQETADDQESYQGATPYHVNYCGFEHCQPGYKFGPRTRTSYLIHVVMRGKGRFFVGDKMYELSAGQMFLIYPGIITTYQADVEDPWSYSWIGFTGYRIETILSQMGFSEEHLVLSVKDAEPLHDCVLNIMDLHKITYANEMYRTAELLRFFAYIMENGSGNKDDVPEYSKVMYAQIAMQYLDNNYMNRIKISELADYIGIDRSHLTKSFREEYHVSPQEYLIQLRMEKAEHLLEESTAPISAIAASVGYPDALAFSRIFKQRNGVSPTEYRSQASDRKAQDNRQDEQGEPR